MTAQPPLNSDAESAGLIATLHATLQRLEELTGGEVDTVSTSSGESYLLRHAQAQWRVNETDKQAAVLDALPAHIALLNPQGTIISVNLAWREFASANFLQGLEFAIGRNYLEVCDRVEGGDAPEAQRAAAGIRSVLAEGGSFSLEYPCHAPTEQRWFLMTVTPLTGARVHGVVVMHVNITERIKIAMELRRSRDEFQELAESMPQIVWITRADGWNIFFNRQWMEYTGLSRAESLGHGWNKPVHPNDQERAMQAWQRATATVGIYSIECRLRRADGIYLWWLIRGVPIADAGGKVRKWFGTCTDINEMKLAELQIIKTHGELSLSKERLRAAIAASGTGTFRWDIRTNQLDWDYSLDELFGLPQGQTIHSLEVFLAAVHPADRSEVIAHCERCARDGVDFAMEFRVVWPDGSIHWLDDRGKTISDDAGRPAYMTGACMDITERKRADQALRMSEQRFKALFEQAAVGVMQVDALTGRFVQVNQRFADIVGRSRAELEKLTFTDITHPQDIAKSLVLARQVTTGTRREFTEDKRYLHKDGTTVWVNLTVSAMWAPGSPPDRYIAVAQDVTERKRFEEQFHQAQKMDAIGTLAGGIAHDFNNVLAAINGYSELAQMRLKGNPEVREFIGSVLQASGRATDLVRQILTFSRHEPPARRHIPLRPVVEEAFKLLRESVPATIEFDLVLAPDAPAVLADATQVHQILMNLGTNAWHAIKDRPGRIQVKLETQVVDEAYATTQVRLRPGTYARISVTDTGCGMEPATLRRIFEPFFTTKPVGQGTGLGLAVVHGIMANHDGAVTVYSQPGEGTVFHLYFPAHTGEPAVAADDHASTPLGHGEQVLFVDDEELLGELGRKVLTALGYTVEVARNPAAALELVREAPSRFALVITDQTMPGMTGLTLAGELKRIRPGLPIILMTGYGLALTLEQVEAAGIQELLIKPTTIHGLGTAVHAALSAQPSQ